MAPSPPIPLPQALAILSAPPWRQPSSVASGFPASAVSPPRTDQMFLSYCTSGPRTPPPPPSFRRQVANKMSCIDVRLFLPGERGDSTSFIYLFMYYFTVPLPLWLTRTLPHVPKPQHLLCRTMTTTITIMLANGVFVVCLADHSSRKRLYFHWLFDQ